jgi:NADH dehydrogenase FAD-containing subunit
MCEWAVIKLLKKTTGVQNWITNANCLSHSRKHGNDKLRFARKYTLSILCHILSLLRAPFQSTIHRLSYRPTTDPLNIVIVGASFTGLHLAKRLTESLNSGYRVVLVEKNSHFNWTFNFPRYSVLKGHEQKAFIPYGGFVENAPEGSVVLMQDTVVRVREMEVELASGKIVESEYLAVATGCSQKLPGKVAATEKAGAIAELRVMQEQIGQARRIAVVGGGAVGVQIAGDIRSWYPEKQIALVHSRKQLLPRFGMMLPEHVVEKPENMNIQVILGQRPILPDIGTGKFVMEFDNGAEGEFDLVVSLPFIIISLRARVTISQNQCTGLTANSSILSQFSPASISKSTGEVLVCLTLQILDSEAYLVFTNFFALGNVAETDGTKVAQARMKQAEVVQSNIMAIIKGKGLGSYVPEPLDGAIKLSLGKVRLWR